MHAHFAPNVGEKEYLCHIFSAGVSAAEWLQQPPIADIAHGLYFLTKSFPWLFVCG